MRKFLCIFVLLLSLSVGSVCYASSLNKVDLVSLAQSYETNLVTLLCGGVWEMPIVDSEFTPSEPMGTYIASEPSVDLINKFNTWKDLSSQLGFLDSGVFPEDVDAYKLTKFELVQLSSVDFSYYYDYSNNEVIQWYTILWADDSISRGYVIWSSSGLIVEVNMY